MFSDIFQETEVTSASTYEAASGKWGLQVVYFTIFYLEETYLLLLGNVTMSIFDTSTRL